MHLSLVLLRGAGQGEAAVEFRALDGTIRSAFLDGRWVALEREQQFVAAACSTTYEGFEEDRDRLDVRIGTVIAVEPVTRSNSHLLRIRVSLGKELRSIFATGLDDPSLVGHYESADELMGRNLVVLANSKPKFFTAADARSDGMFLGLEAEDRVALLTIRVPGCMRPGDSRARWLKIPGAGITLLGYFHRDVFLPAVPDLDVFGLGDSIV